MVHAGICNKHFIPAWLYLAIVVALDFNGSFHSAGLLKPSQTVFLPPSKRSFSRLQNRKYTLSYKMISISGFHKEKQGQQRAVVMLNGLTRKHVVTFFNAIFHVSWKAIIKTSPIFTINKTGSTCASF